MGGSVALGRAEDWPAPCNTCGWHIIWGMSAMLGVGACECALVKGWVAHLGE